jgi:hypothetical protein
MNKEDVIQLFLDAEKLNRSGKIDEAIDLKLEFSQSYNDLPSTDKTFVDEYLESVGA